MKNQGKVIIKVSAFKISYMDSVGVKKPNNTFFTYQNLPRLLPHLDYQILSTHLPQETLAIPYRETIFLRKILLFLLTAIKQIEIKNSYFGYFAKPCTGGGPL